MLCRQGRGGVVAHPPLEDSVPNRQLFCRHRWFDSHPHHIWEPQRFGQSWFSATPIAAESRGSFTPFEKRHFWSPSHILSISHTCPFRSQLSEMRAVPRCHNANMVTHSELQTTTSVKCFLIRLPGIGPPEMPRRIGQPCGQCTVGGHVAVISLWLDWVRKVDGKRVWVRHEKTGRSFRIYKYFGHEY